MFALRQVLNSKPTKPLREQLHLNVMSPIATFHATQFADSAHDKVNTTPGSLENVAVLPFATVVRFDEYWRLQHQLVLTGELQAAYVERSICRTVAYLLGAAIHLHNHGWPKPRLDWNHVVMVPTSLVSPGECLPLLRPSTKTSPAAVDRPSSLFSDVHQLVSIMLEPDVVESGSDAADKPPFLMSEPDDSVPKLVVRRVDIASFLSTDSPYARCLQRVLRHMQQAVSSARWDATVAESLRMLEFVLWGPREDEARLAAVSETRDQDLKNWLALSRCRLVAQLTADENVLNAELLCKAQFLCDVTEMEILDITKSLFFDP